MVANMTDAPQDSTSVKLCVEVVAGLVPGKTPDPEFTQRWYISSEDWRRAQAQGGKEQDLCLMECVGQAQLYASVLMMQPQRLNWVRVDWVWF